MHAIGCSCLTILLLVLQLIALSVSFFCLAPDNNRLEILVLLSVSVLVSTLMIRIERNLARSLAQLVDNALRVRQRQKLLPLALDERFSNLDKILQEISIDISELERKEHAVINHALDVICSVGNDQLFQSVNPAVAKLWGYAPSELIGRKFSDLLLEEDRQESLRSLFGAEKSVDTLSVENRVRRKDGSVVHALWSAHWSAVDQALFCVAHDITARKLAEQLLEESEQRMRQIFDDMPVGLIMSNKLGIIEMSNPALDSMCQTEAQELIGQHIKIIFRDLIKSAAPPDYEKIFARLVDTTVGRKSGTRIPVHVSARELIMGGDKKYLLVLIDTTERERLEELKREFFAMVNHDLRSPLTSLLSVLDALEAGTLGELSLTGKEVIGRNLREVGRLIKLVDELLDIEKMQSGKFVIDAELSAVDTIVEASIAALELLAQRRNISIGYAKSGLYVFADFSLLIRVLVNLLSNAVKFSPPRSSIDIEVNQREQEILFSVKDMGRGIPPEFRQRIFEHYEQVEHSDRRLHGGTGLGLPICKMIVEQHGGLIWVESVGGPGSIFKFTIPRRDPLL